MRFHDPAARRVTEKHCKSTQETPVEVLLAAATDSGGRLLTGSACLGPAKRYRSLGFSGEASPDKRVDTFAAAGLNQIHPSRFASGMTSSDGTST
jgi:hypothetical protein